MWQVMEICAGSRLPASRRYLTRWAAYRAARRLRVRLTRQHAQPVSPITYSIRHAHPLFF